MSKSSGWAAREPELTRAGHLTSQPTKVLVYFFPLAPESGRLANKERISSSSWLSYAGKLVQEQLYAYNWFEFGQSAILNLKLEITKINCRGKVNKAGWQSGAEEEKTLNLQPFCQFPDSNWAQILSCDPNQHPVLSSCTSLAWIDPSFVPLLWLGPSWWLLCWWCWWTTGRKERRRMWSICSRTTSDHLQVLASEQWGS